MNLGLSDSPFVELIIVVALTVSILTAWRMLSRKRGATRDVDPLAEAEVYIAYGRKKEAAEILKEAIKAYPDRRTEFEAKLRELQGAAAPVSPVTKV